MLKEMKSAAESDPLIINEAQLVLAEKRTSLATLRTGIAVLTLPIGMLGFLVVVSKYYSVSAVLAHLILLMIIGLCLLGLGFYLIVRALIKLHRADHILQRLKAEHSVLSRVLD